jgi:hypothetical protein
LKIADKKTGKRPPTHSQTRMISTRGLLAIAFAVFTSAAHAQTPPATTAFPSAANEFAFTTLSISPSNATQDARHRFNDPRIGKVMLRDQMLDDFSPGDIARRHAFYQDSSKKPGEGSKFLIRSGVGVVGLFVGLVPGAYAGVATTGDCHGEDCGLAQLVIGGLVGGFVGAAAGAAIPRLNSSCSYVKRLGRGAVGSFVSAIVALPLLVSGQAGAVLSAAVPPMGAALAIRGC